MKGGGNMRTINLFLILACLSNSNFVSANLSLNDLNESQLKGFVEDFGANFSHRSVTGASSLGNVFGFEAALVGGTTSSPRTNDLSKQAGGGDLNSLITGALLLGVSVPFGFTFEGMLFPSLTVSGVRLSGNSLGLRWTTNDVLPILPFNLAFRYNISQASLGFSQSIPGADGNISAKTSVQEFGIYASPNLPVIEPYAGIGLINMNGDVTFTGSGTIFNTSYTTSKSASVSTSSLKYVLGVSFYLPFFTAGVEYVSLLGTSGFGGKLGISF